MSSALSAPAPLSDRHDLAAFASGDAPLDEWLRRRPRANQVTAASRTFVAAEGARVVAYYAAASGAIAAATAPGRFRRNMPDPIPIVLLGRLAVDHRWQGQGIGRGLFRDCCRRVMQAADAIGIRGIAVHAISEQAKRFVGALGFEASATDPMLLLVTLADVRALPGATD